MIIYFSLDFHFNNLIYYFVDHVKKDASYVLDLIGASLLSFNYEITRLYLYCYIYYYISRNTCIGVVPMVW